MLQICLLKVNQMMMISLIMMTMMNFIRIQKLPKNQNLMELKLKLKKLKLRNHNIFHNPNQILMLMLMRDQMKSQKRNQKGKLKQNQKKVKKRRKKVKMVKRKMLDIIGEIGWMRKLRIQQDLKQLKMLMTIQFMTIW